MDSLPLYQQLAHHYRHAIVQGTLSPGDRMPSVRALMQRHRVSLSTALQACRQLERDGLLEARPRLGYYVTTLRSAPRQTASEPASLRVDPAQYVGIHERVSSFLARAGQASVEVNLAGACGAPELYPTEALRSAMTRVLRQQPLLLGHPVTPAGHAPFRAAVARLALSAGVTVSPDEIVVTHGCTEALTLALRAVTQPGDIVAVESPTYYGLLQILEGLGLRALEIPTSPHTGISLEALELAARHQQGLKAVVINPTLQNPQGAIMPEAHRRRLVNWCETEDLALIEDDSYSALADVPEPVQAAKAWDRSGNVILCASLHKIVAPGLRLGWLTAGKWQARVEMLKYSQSRPNELLGQIAVADFFASGALERHLARFKPRLREQRARMADAVTRHFPAGTRFSEPPGGLNLWVQLPDGASSQALFEAALLHGIRISPGLMFSNSDRFDGYIRLNCGLPFSPAIDAALHTLGELVARQQR